MFETHAMLEVLAGVITGVYILGIVIALFKFDKRSRQMPKEDRVHDSAIVLLSLLWPLAIVCYLSLKFFHELPNEEATHNHHYSQKKENE